MLRAIFFLDCDFCHQAHSKPEIVEYVDTYMGFHGWAFLEESALGDGWCQALMEDTGEYRIMCNDCQFELDQEQKRQAHAEDDDIDF